MTMTITASLLASYGWYNELAISISIVMVPLEVVIYNLLENELATILLPLPLG